MKKMVENPDVSKNIQRFTDTCDNCWIALKPGTMQKLSKDANGDRICPVANCNGKIISCETLALGMYTALETSGHHVNNIHIGLPTEERPYIEIVFDKGYTISTLPEGFTMNPDPYLEEPERDRTPMTVRRTFDVDALTPSQLYKEWARAYADITRWAFVVRCPVVYRLTEQQSAHLAACAPTRSEAGASAHSAARPRRGRRSGG